MRREVRRAAAFFQDRVGPNRVGPFGLLQPLADGLKFILKEELVPAGAMRGVFLAAPVLILASAMLACELLVHASGAEQALAE